MLSPGDVTQQATWRPPCGVRRVMQKRSQLYTKKSNVSRNFLYGLSMSSSPNLNIHLLWVFFSFKYCLNQINNLDRSEIIILGDLNLDYSNTASDSCRLLASIEEEFTLKQTIQMCTRTNRDLSTLIDVIFF